MVLIIILDVKCEKVFIKEWKLYNFMEKYYVKFEMYFSRIKG